MHSSFDQTLRSLERPERWSPLLIASVLLLGAWLGWFVFAQVEVYASSQQARLEVSQKPNRASALEAGRIIAVHCALGARAREGDVLLELDSSLLQAQIAGELATLASHDLRVAAVTQQIAVEEQVGASRLRMDELATRRASVELAQAEAAAEHQKTLTNMARELDALRLSARVDKLNAEARMVDQHLLVHRAAVDRDRLSATREFDGLSQQARVAALRRELTELNAERSLRLATLELLRAQLARTQIRAPIDGVIGSIAPLQVGDVVKLGDVVATLIPPQRVHVVAQFAPSQALGRVVPGQAARVRLNGFSWLEFGFVHARVMQVANEPQDGTIRVELQIAQHSLPGLSLQHGLPGSVDIRVERASPLQLMLRSVGAAAGATSSGGAV